VSVSVVVPWRGGCAHRERAWAWLQNWYRDHHPDFEVIVGQADGDGWRKADAILNGARRAAGDVIVVADADVVTDLQPAIDHVAHVGWAIPHLRVIRLDESGTTRFMAGERDEANLSTVSGRLGPGKHQGRPGGGVVVIERDLLFDVAPDRRFVGWGQEDDSWALALRVLAGKAWRGNADLWHLYHPPQERMDRGHGNPDGVALWERYNDARHSPAAMRQLIDEAREA
jgi:hypothetical protein